MGRLYPPLPQDWLSSVALMTGGTAAIGFTESPGMPPEYKPQFDIDTPWDGFQQVLDDCVPTAGHSRAARSRNSPKLRV